jgi:poly(3-hydroxybutyrate) depolymerase
VAGEEVPVTQETVMSAPFGTLLHFRKAHTGGEPHPPVLLVAPLSGHFATLLRDTVRTLLQDHDVYITDWHNARDVPLSPAASGWTNTSTAPDPLPGRCMGPGAHLMAICQPCVAALAATAMMAEDEHPATPASLTLMAGPIDCRINPTAVNTWPRPSPSSGSKAR